MTELLSSMGLLAGGSLASGINLYMTTASMGVAHRMGWVTLPGDMDFLAHPLVIGTAALMYFVEFFADKIPYVDSMWDSVHTFIRPVGGAAMGYLAMANAGPAVQYPVAMLTGTVALDAHLTKATARAAINTSPEPITNSVASLTEDFSVAGMMVLIAQHPVIATLVVIAFLLFSIWFLKTMFRFVKKIFSTKKPEQPSAVSPANE